MLFLLPCCPCLRERKALSDVRGQTPAEMGYKRGKYGYCENSPPYPLRRPFTSTFAVPIKNRSRRIYCFELVIF